MSARADDAVAIAGVPLTHPDKVLYPEQGITKQDLAEYYLAVADRMLPHVAGRPLTLVRCPAGRQRKCFYQRHAGSGVPDELGEVKIAGFEEPYLFIKDAPGLIAPTASSSTSIRAKGSDSATSPRRRRRCAPGSSAWVSSASPRRPAA